MRAIVDRNRLPYCGALILAALVLGVCFLVGPALARNSHVMVVNSYHDDLPWVMEHNGALRKALESSAKLTFINLDTKRVPPGEFQVRADIAYGRIIFDSPDVVVLADDNAVQLLGKRVMDLDIPVVYLGVNENPRTYLGSMPMATGVLERPLFKRSLIFLHELFGRPLKKALILFDSGTTAHVIMEMAFKGKSRKVVAGIQTEVRLLDTFAAWQVAVATAREEGFDILCTGLYHTLTDGKGTHVSSDTVIRWTSEHSEIPVFAFWDFAVGKGMAVGGLVNSGEEQGKEAAVLVKRILEGEPPGNIYPVTAENGRFMFSRHELDRWNLKLPESYADDPQVVRLVD